MHLDPLVDALVTKPVDRLSSEDGGRVVDHFLIPIN